MSRRLRGQRPPCLLRLLYVLCLAGLTAPAALADGLHLAFHGSSGIYTVTVFSAPDPLVAGEAQLTLLVQRTADSALLDRATASGSLTLPGVAAIPLRFRPGGSANRQLLGTTVRLNNPGTYALALEVDDPGSAAADFKGTLPVETNHGQRNTLLIWVFVPCVIIFLFLINQFARQQLRKARTRASQVTSG